MPPPAEAANLINNEDGYAVRLPDEWTVNPRPLDLANTGSVTVVDGTHDGTFYSRVLTISVGESDGSVPVCDRGLCRDVLVRDVGDLGNALASASQLCQVEETRFDVVVDGEPWQLEEPEYRSSCLGAPAAKYHLFGFHLGRPFVFAFDYWVIRFNRFEYSPTSDWATGWGPVGQIIDSFRFLDRGTPSADPRGWKSYTSPQNGYEIAIPSNWTASESYGATYFRSYGQVMLLVSAGTRAGWVTVCSGIPCDIVRVDGIDDLDASVLTAPTRIGRIPEQTVDVELDGWPARVQGPEPNRFLEGPPANLNVFGILDGRPVVLRFNYSYRQQHVPTATQSAVIDSFALLRD